MTYEVLGLSGKVAVVVGGGQGMGRSTALALARAGADCLVADIVLERAESVAREVEGLDRRAVALQADVRDEAATEQIIPAAVEALGTVDILVNIAGAAYWSGLIDMHPRDWDLQLAQNLRYVFLTSRGAARVIRDHGRGGAIVSIASIDGIGPAVGHGAYGVAKAGVIQLTKTMAMEWDEYGIRVNCIAPAGTATPRRAGGPAAPQSRVMGRQTEPDEIASMVLFLVSDMGSHVTGQTLPLGPLGGLAPQPGFDLGEIVARGNANYAREPTAAAYTTAQRSQ